MLKQINIRTQYQQQFKFKSHFLSSPKCYFFISLKIKYHIHNSGPEIEKKIIEKAYEL